MSMKKSNKIKKELLEIEDFEKYSVWTWDPSHDFHVPVLEKKPDLEKYEIFFIFSTFKSQNHIFKGSVLDKK